MESVELVEFLLNNGANPHQTDNLGLSALDDARLRCNSNATIQDVAGSAKEEWQERVARCIKIKEILNHGIFQSE